MSFRESARRLAWVSAIAALAATATAEAQGSGVLRRESVRVGGRTRTYLAYVPGELGPRPALILAFHGGGGDGAGLSAAFGGALEELAAERGFVLVYPDGYERHWNDCRHDAPFSANRLDVDDVDFVRTLIESLERKEGVDPARVHALGFSNGGLFAYRLALEAPDLIGSVAAFGANLPAAQELDCEVAEGPVRVMIVNGTADPNMPFEGGEVRASDGAYRGRVVSTRETAEFFARRAAHGPDAAQHSTLVPTGADGLWVERAAWGNGAAPDVVLLTVHGGGHTLPGRRSTQPEIAGPTERRLEGAAEAVHFFLGPKRAEQNGA